MVLTPPYHLPYDIRGLPVLRENNTSGDFSAPHTDHLEHSNLSSERPRLAAKVLSKLCAFDEDCDHLDTACDHRARRCLCPDGYYAESVLRSSLQRVSALIETDLTCLRPAHIGQPCISDTQCVASGSICERDVADHGVCVCRYGLFESEGFERYLIDGEEVSARTVCRLDGDGKADGFVAMVIIVGLVSLVALIGCLIGLIRMRKKKRDGDTMVGVVGGNGQQGQGGNQQQFMPGQQYMTSTGQIVMATADGRMVPVAASQNHPQQQFGGPTNHPALAPGLPGRAAVVTGSAQAEFQNDFIEVFPMHQIEPCPEKNMSMTNQ